MQDECAGRWLYFTGSKIKQEKESGLKTTPTQMTADGNADRIKALWGMWIGRNVYGSIYEENDMLGVAINERC